MSTSVANANEISHFERTVRTFLAYSFLEENNSVSKDLGLNVGEVKNNEETYLSLQSITEGFALTSFSILAGFSSISGREAIL
jgi:hypothetical protein